MSRHATEFVVLFLPHVQQALNFVDSELSQSQIVFGTVANYARDSSSRTILIKACRALPILTAHRTTRTDDRYRTRTCARTEDSLHR